MTRARRRPARGAALISAVVILLIVALFTATTLALRSNQASTQTLRVQRVQAEAAAQGALQLAAWHVQNHAELRTALSAATAHDDVSPAAPPLYRFTGALGGSTFEAAVWPTAGAVRIQSIGRCGPVRAERWSQILTRGG